MSFFKAVGVLKHRDILQGWEISYLYPELTESQIAEKVAAYFNTISVEYPPLPCPARRDEGIIIIQPHEVAARLRTFKKPKSKVEGDIDPQIVNRFHDILAIPLTYIYNKALNMLEWPEL